MECSDNIDGNVSFVYDVNNVNIQNELLQKAKNVKCRTVMMKRITLLTLVAAGIIPGYVLLGHDVVQCTPQQWEPSEMNTTPLVLLYRTEQFSLENNVFLSFCKISNQTYIDIRHFANGNATDFGVTLNISQCNTLKSLLP